MKPVIDEEIAMAKELGNLEELVGQSVDGHPYNLPKKRICNLQSAATKEMITDLQPWLHVQFVECKCYFSYAM